MMNILKHILIIIFIIYDKYIFIYLIDNIYHSLTLRILQYSHENGEFSHGFTAQELGPAAPQRALLAAPANSSIGRVAEAKTTWLGG